MKAHPILPLPADLLEKMAATEQNPRYHREGSVLAHTAYVLRQFEALQSRFELSDKEKQILYWAAILHDVGKTVTTVFEQDRWRSPGHEKAGLPFAQNILLQNPDIDAPTRRKILDIVRWHGLPLRFAAGQMGYEDLILLGTRTDLRLLSIFSIFDFEGRDCDDKTETMARIYKFNEVLAPKAEYELGRFSELENSFSKWNLRHKNAVWNAFKMKNIAFLQKLVEANQVNSPMTMGKKVTIVMGEALSGKSTWIQENHPHAFVVSLAEHGFLEQNIDGEYLLGRKLVEFKHLLVVYLNRHRQVILETRHLPDLWRRKLAEMVKDMEVELEYVIIEASLDELENRLSELPAPKEALDLKAKYHSLDLIHPWEAHATSYVKMQ